MKTIVHICLLGTVTPGGTYQDNIITKYHARQGLEVSIISSKWQQDGKCGHCLNPNTDYINADGVKVYRLPMLGKENPYKRLKIFPTLKEHLHKIAPDIIFIHGFQFLNIITIINYVKQHPKVKIYVDCHADFSNSARSWLSKNIWHKCLWRFFGIFLEPYVTKFYGTLPARVDFLKEMYNFPIEKCELLVMGADDEMVADASRPEVRTEVREKYKITAEDFLIVTGGKIDAFKTQTLLLMQAVKNIKSPKVKLLIFGSVTKDLQDQVKQLTDGVKIQYIGWIKGQDTYKYFAAADLACFPGRHSVLWEQAVGQGLPLIVKEWAGTKHVDLGGNVRFLTKDKAEEIQQNIEDLFNNPNKYKKMKQAALDNGMKYFSYADIAKRSIQV